MLKDPFPHGFAYSVWPAAVTGKDLRRRASRHAPARFATVTVLDEGGYEIVRRDAAASPKSPTVMVASQ
ncbi:hypothetical protein J7E87_10270 [Streptomyces sp. ISL-1]|uniref:hypothetical protein n=1 Tax=Streptomyces sp. ISL-1 TaxID=2817657 RepID=UPI001BE749DA|nr:hypothetical protein [Streptomyces sp. ISL-1]MBT2389807.1 hypothetical protein [Streptomyces sp. ISL-1]